MEEILINRLSKFVEDIKFFSDQARSLCNIINNDNLEAAKVVRAKLTSILSRFTSELYNYFNICKSPDPDQISDFTTYQLQGEELLAELDAKLNITDQPTTSTRSNAPLGYSKLPDLNLPEFSGNLLEWRSFWDQFISNISRRNLNDVDKLLYLKSSLKGDAARLIDGFDTTNKSYQIAVDTLKARYGKDDEIIYAHHKALSQVKRAEKIEDCRGTLDEISRHLRVLQSMKENTDTNQLHYLVMEKFPTEIIYEIKMRLSSDGVNSIQSILTQLATVISAKEEARKITQENLTETTPSYTVETLHVNEATRRGNGDQSTSNSNGRKFQNPNRKQWNNFKTRFTSGKARLDNNPMKRKFVPTRERDGSFSGIKRKKWPCVFCGGNHDNVNCDKVKTIDERKAKLKDRCFCCLRLGHIALNCSYKKKCQYCGKHGIHNRAICPHKFQVKKGESTSVMFVGKECATVLQTAVTTVKGPNTSKMCRILLHCGSQKSYVTQEIAEKLKLQTEERNTLAIFTFGSQKPKEIESPLVKLGVVTRDKSLRTLYANVVPSISHGVPHPDKALLDQRTQEKYPLADNGSLSDRVDILLGNDYYYTIMSTKKICIREDLYLVESDLGWILSGKTSNKPAEQLSVLTYFQSSCEVGLNSPDPPLGYENMKTLWELESIGITDSPKTTKEEEAVNHFNDNVNVSEGRYQVKWPWTEYPPELPNNYGLALGRLKSLLRRSDNVTLDSYYETLKEQIQAKVIEEVEPCASDVITHPVHYLPHHMVHQKGKKGRIVYDASAKVNGHKSLNECLYRGPLTIGDLTGLILNFRVNKIALTADVEKAFLQVGLQAEDRDVTRFLWVKDPKREVTSDNIIQYRFCRIPFGIISSPFMLNATIKHHLSKNKDESVKKLANQIYVDNLVTGTESTEEALELYRSCKETFQQISMNLRDWSSNSKEFMQRVPDTCPDRVIKVLGLKWHIEEDTLQIKTSAAENANTKRGILKSVASIYDPCGFAVPTLLPAKLLLQDLWKLKMKWDTPLPADIIDKWSAIKQNFDEVKDIILPRRYLDTRTNDCEIHCFTDSSIRAYAAVVYIIGKDQISFAIGKSRLVPIKDQEHLKIPRLELLGVLIGSRLIQYVLKSTNLNVTKQILWTDSQIVIDWCNSNKLLTPFVARRVEEIKRNKDLTIRYVPSKLNPADVATRPESTKEDRKRWLAGPDFLLQEPSTWPTRATVVNTLLVGEDLTNTDVSQEMEVDPEPTDVNRTCRNSKDDIHVKQAKESRTDSNILKEIMDIQAECFKDEMNGKMTSLSRNLGLFKDVDGVLRCKGRFKYANWSFDKRYPILLPKDSEFTAQLIKNTHEKNYHVGATHTLSIIRETYWIPQGKRTVLKILNKCSSCKKHGGGPFELPPTPALPAERVTYSKPYTFTGMDYLGPIMVKTDSNTCVKKWICLFTCLAVRAIHLEVVNDLSAEEGLLALRRMCSIRGVPTLITTDNAMHFKLIAEIISKPYCVKNKIKWRFIPELAPWFGGFYERLVGLVKHCMRRTLNKTLLKDSQLTTIIKEIENILNTRPLTPVDSEIEHILKPQDFLQLGECLALQTSDQEIPIQGTSTKISLIQGWRRARVMLDEFEEMFRNRYLPSLRERYGHSHKQPRVTSNLTPNEGQIVQIKGDKNREGWKVGKIVSLVKGSDGLVRVAQVKVGDTIFTRSIAHLYPLEVEDNERYDPVTQDIKGSLEIRQLPSSEISSQSDYIPDTVTVDADNSQRDSLAYDETRKVDDVDVVRETVDVTRNETDTAEIRDNVQNDPNVIYTPTDNLKDDDSLLRVEDPVEIQSNDKSRPRRIAAVQALQKIKEWTHNLSLTLLTL